MLAHRRRRQLRKAGLIAITFIGAVVVGGSAALVTEWLAGSPPQASAASGTHYAEALSGCSVTDGDTIRCGDERIRLLGIDAPEMPEHCRPGRDCVEGDPYASTSNLAAAMTGKLTINRIGEDHYGRTLAVVGAVAGWAAYEPFFSGGLGAISNPARYACPLFGAIVAGLHPVILGWIGRGNEP